MNWLIKLILGEIFKEIVNDFRSVRVYGSVVFEIVLVVIGNLEVYMMLRF